MNKDYKDFLNSKDEAPRDLAQRTHLIINRELNPDHRLIFGKLVFIHSFIGLLTMLFCPQFNLSLTNSYEVFHYLHRIFGHEVCMLICGSIFLGSGAFVATLILSEGEIRKVKDSKFLYYLCLSILAVSTFMIFGADIYLNLVIFWVLGAVIGSAVLFILGYGFRIQVWRQLRRL